MSGVGIATRISWNQQILTYGFQEFKFTEQSDSSQSDMEFEFLEDGDQENTPELSCGTSTDDNNIEEMVALENDDEKEENDENSVENDKSFWENQYQVLQSTLCRSSSLESRIRKATKEALKDIQKACAGNFCGCRKPMADQSCRLCLMNEVCSRLQNAGFNAAICRSKWRSSQDIPSGEHTFMDVIENTKTGEVRVIIELNFRAEFEIARANEEYNYLVQRLPEVYVGKVERLNNVIKLLCMAAKKCMKEKKMHMGPWRKHKYMQSKWLKSCQRNTSTTNSLSMGYNNSGGWLLKPKPRASMLTVDLLDMLSNVRCASAVKVV